MTIPVLHLLSQFADLEPLHILVGIIFGSIFLVAGISVLMGNAFTKPEARYSKESARIGLALIGLGIACVIFGAYFFMAAILAGIVYLVWRIIIRNIWAAFTGK